MAHAIFFSPDALKRARLSRPTPMSVTALAAAIDRTEGAVQGYEAGKFAPSTDVLGRLAEALDCSVADLFESPSEVAR